MSRWLVEFPITREEVLALLDKLPWENPPGTPIDQLQVGGINDSIRHYIVEFISEPANMEQLLERMKV